MNVTIDRAVWLRGEGPNASFLLRRKDQKRCCIGILCGVLGITDSLIIDVHSPFGDASTRELDVAFESALNKDREELKAVLDPLYNINDDPNTDDESRERCLTVNAKEIGVTFTFVGGKA